MRVEPNQIIAGFPAKKVRDALEDLARQNCGGSAEYFSEKLNCSKRKTSAFIKDMLGLGYLEKGLKDKSENIQYYKTTLKGNTLAQASARPPIKRGTAEKKIQELINRAEEINKNDYAYKIERLTLFGSILSNSETVNDIDVAIKMVPSFQNRTLFEQARDRAIKRSTRRLNSWIAELSWPETEVYQKLKNRSPMYSFHSDEEIEMFKEKDSNYNYKVIYNLAGDKNGPQKQNCSNHGRRDPGIHR